MAKREASPSAAVPGGKRQATAPSRLLAETFNVNDPIHGMIMLPKILKKFIDHRYFQRLRYIRQLSMCTLVYPGATHDRFFHSIGTAYLSFNLVKNIRERQPEIDISDVDHLCITLAALLHDLGHPCFSHMFEVFVHRAGKKKPGLTDEQREKYAHFEHEDASVALVRLLWVELKADLEAAQLTEVDLEFVCALISPPKKELGSAMENGKLGEIWSNLMNCRPHEKGWMFEIVSNWRSGLDVDRFDYFRRDAQYLGIHKEFDHQRYMQTVRVTFDHKNGVWTLSPPDKDKDFLREDMLELRRSLHRKAYQHKTTQKLEQHMIDVLELMENAGLKLRTSDGKMLGMSEAAAEFNASAYVQLIDCFVESKLFELPGPDSPLQAAYDEYERRIIRRQMFRLLADFDVPADMDFAVYSGDQIIQHTLNAYRSLHASGEMATEAAPRANEEMVGLQELDAKLFRCSVAEFHQGMKRKDPLMRVLFYSSKDHSQADFLKASEEVPPLTQKVFLFYDAGPEAHNGLLFRQLVASFLHWARSRSDTGGDKDDSQPKTQQQVPASVPPTSSASPVRNRRLSGGVEQARIQNSPAKIKPRRMLQVRSSAIMEDP